MMMMSIIMKYKINIHGIISICYGVDIWLK